VVARCSGHAVFIRAVVYDRGFTSEIVMRRRCGRRPLERSCLPWIVAGFRPLEHAPEQVEEEHELNRDREEGRVRHEPLERNQIVQVSELRELRITARMSRETKVMHWHEDGISPNEGDPEMDSPHALVHHASEHLWEPIVGCGEDAKDSRYPHDQ